MFCEVLWVVVLYGLGFVIVCVCYVFIGYVVVGLLVRLIVRYYSIWVEVIFIGWFYCGYLFYFILVYMCGMNYILL